MNIIRTNASTGGGCTSDYDIWQQGFGVSWDNVIPAATFPTILFLVKALHIYYAVDKLYLQSFRGNYGSTPRPIAIYNANTNTYRYTTTIIGDAFGNHYIQFEHDDYFTNSYDNKQYCCVIYPSQTQFGNWIFRGQLPVVYANNKYAGNIMQYISLIQESNASALYPNLRGVDFDYLNPIIRIYDTIEHLGYNTTSINGQLINYSIVQVSGSNIQGFLFKKIYEDLVLRGNTFNPVNSNIFNLILTDQKLANWFYNDFYYNIQDFGYYNFTTTGQSNTVDIVKLKERQLIPNGNGGYAKIPNCVHIEGFFDEAVTEDAWQGMHGFPNMVNLCDYPLWKVEENATTGNLKPIKTVNTGNFTFGSSVLFDRNKLCEFETIEGTLYVKESDPNVFFLNNLPVQSILPGVARITFSPTTAGDTINKFKNKFTVDEQNAISDYIINTKKYLLSW